MLVLASASPRRRELLSQMGEEFRVQAADISEERLAGEKPSDYVRRLALEKARTVWERLAGDREVLGAGRGNAGDVDQLIVLGADTVVVCGDELLGKPTDAGDAQRMLRLLSGRAHQVLTGVAVVSRNRAISEVESTTVVFAAVPDAEIADYIATGEPFDKAGAYGIQGRAARWIPRIEGCYFNVVGLPLARVAAMLATGRAGL